MLWIGPQAEEGVILKAVAIEATNFEPVAIEPAEVETTTLAPEPRVKPQVHPQPGSSTEVAARELVIEQEAPLRLALMQESGTSSHGGLELLDDELIDAAVVSLNMES